MLGGGMDHMIGVLIQGNEQLTSVLGKADGALHAFGETAKETQRKIDGLKMPTLHTAPLQRQSVEWKKVGAAAVVAGGAALAGFGMSVRGAMEFETAMAEVSTLVDTNVVDMGALSDKARDLASEFRQMPVSVAQGLYPIISAGFNDAASSAQVLESSLKLAIGGITETGIAADGLTSILNAWKIEAKDSINVSDDLFVAMRAGKTTIAELSSEIGKVAPMAATAGASYEEVLSAASALTLGGMGTAESMTALRQVFASVLKPTEKAKKAAKELGIEFNTATLRSMGMEGFLDMLVTKTGGSETKMTELFESTEAMTGVFALTGNQAGAFSQILSDMGSAAGQTDLAVEKMLDTGASAWAGMKTNISLLTEQIGESLAPTIEKISSGLGSIAKGLREFGEAHPILSKILTTMTAFLAVVAVIVPPVIMAAKVIVPTIMAIGAAIAALPVAWIVAGAAAIVAAITGVSLYFSGATDEIQKDAGILGDVWNFVVEGFYAITEPIAFGLGYMVGMLSNGWDEILRYTEEIWPMVEKIITKSWKVASAIFGPILEVMVALVAGAWAAIGELTAGVFGGIVNVIRTGWDLISGLFKAALQLLTGDWSGAWETVKRTFSTVWEDIKGMFWALLDWIKGLAKLFWSAGGNLIQSLADGMVAKSDALGVGVITDWLSDVMPGSGRGGDVIMKPLVRSGEGATTALATGIRQGEVNPIAAVSSLVTKMRAMLPGSDAETGPLSDLTASGTALFRTFAQGMAASGSEPLSIAQESLVGIGAATQAPIVPQPNKAGAEERSGTQKPSVVFQKGAFQISVSGGEAVDDLETRLEQVFGRIALQLGGA